MPRQTLQEQFKAEADKFGAQTSDAKDRRARAWNDFGFFCQTYLPHYFTLPLAPFQRRIERALIHDQFVAVAAPREFGKSVLTGIGLPIWGMVTGRLRFQVDIGPSLDHARNNIMSIRDELESNELLIADFGPQRPEYTESKSVTWTQTMLVTRDRSAIVGRGAGASLRGIRYREFRPDLVRLDDIEDDETVENPDQRAKLWNWFKRVVMFLGREARIFVIGTVLHYDSMLAKLLAGSIPKFNGLKFQGLLPDGSSLWPELVSTDRLLQLRQEDPVSFAAEIQNEPIDEESALFKLSDIRFYKPREIDGKQLDAYWFCDPSLGGSKRADFTAMITIGVERKTNIIYVLNAFIERINRSALIGQVFDDFERFQPAAMGFESVGFQKVLKEWIDEKSRLSRSYLPIKAIDQKGISKDARIERLSPLIEQGLIRFPERGAERLIDQLVRYGKTDHDDGPDALEGAVNLVRGFGGNVGFRSKPCIYRQVERWL